MGTVIRICDENGNKYSGFELAKTENIRQLFPNSAYVGCKFSIGIYEYEVTNIYVDGFYNKNTKRKTLDSDGATMTSHIWIYCSTKDPRIHEGNINDETQSNICKDLNIKYSGF